LSPHCASVSSLPYEPAPLQPLRSFPTRRSSDLHYEWSREGTRLRPGARGRERAARTRDNRNHGHRAGHHHGNGRLSLARAGSSRSEEHTSELQSHLNLVCRLLLEKQNKVKT